MKEITDTLPSGKIKRTNIIAKHTDYQAEYDKWVKDKSFRGAKPIDLHNALKPAYKAKQPKQLNVYERLELLEKQGKCIPKLRKEVADLRKQVYGHEQ